MNKIKRLEQMRFSILTKDLNKCYICGGIKNDLHEVYAGSNRVNSMKWGCVIPLCRNCHNRIHKDTTLYSTKIKGILYPKITFMEETQIKMQHAFNKEYPIIDFLNIFHYDYINGLQVKRK